MGVKNEVNLSEIIGNLALINEDSFGGTEGSDVETIVDGYS